jgi:hypothetical protein
MLNVASRLLRYKTALERGELEVLGEGEVRGRQAIQVRRQWLSGPVTVTSWIDKETLLPLEETFSETNVGDQPTVIGTAIWTYTVLEKLSREQVPADVFALDVPPDANRVTTTYMSTTDTAGFRDFDIYYVGPSFNGLPIFAMSQVQATGPKYPEQLVSFDVTYAEPFTDTPRRPDQLSIIQMPRAPDTPREVAPGVPATGEEVEVRGIPAVLYSTGTGMDLEIELGDTFIRIHGDNRAQVLGAADSLQKLN